ncbi:MAG: hypothetical protein ACAI35_07635 [Candidatus Methylacidiphilales bacterium]|nr:hypothetical protein [Candidatus Methylacidiphilales bacterium]
MKFHKSCKGHSKTKPAKRAYGLKRIASAFSILELTLATAIFSIATVSLAQCLIGVMEASSNNSRLTRIRLAIQNYMAEARVLKLKTGRETLTSDLPDVRFDRDIQPLPLTLDRGRQVQGLYTVRITASWMGTGGPMSEVAELLLTANPATANRN